MLPVLAVLLEVKLQRNSKQWNIWKKIKFKNGIPCLGSEFILFHSMRGGIHNSTRAATYGGRDDFVITYKDTYF